MQRTRILVAAGIGLILGFGAGWGGLRLVRGPPQVAEPSDPSPQEAPLPDPRLPDPEASEGRDSESGAAPRFVDVARAAGVQFEHVNGLTGKYHYPEVMGGGVGLLDYDGDGLLDLYFVQGNHLLAEPSPELKNRLYRNNGDGTFSDVTEEAGVGDAGFGQGVCVGDFDSDGDSDLYVSNYGPNLLYQNNGNGTFREIAAAAGVQDRGWGQSCSFLDYDGDGRLDLYMQNYLEYSMALVFEAFIYIGDKKVLDYPSPRHFSGAPDILYRNNGDGTFTDVTQAAKLLPADGKGMGCACFDYDDDGHTDLFVANDSMENYLFHNRGDGTFEEVGLAAGVAYDGTGIAEASMGVDVGDYDGDGRFDIVTPCVWQQVYSLYRNEGAYFTDVSLPSGLAQATSPYTGFSPGFIDYDNDGDPDLFFSNGGVRMQDTATEASSYETRYGIPDLLLENDGAGHYLNVSSLAGEHFRKSTIGRGSAVGDLDNDGDLDIVVTALAGAASILRNDTPRTNHWITLYLTSSAGVREPIGTSVWCEAGGRRRRAVIHGGVTYLSQGDRRIHFGLGAAGRVDKLEIRWPDGTKQVVEGLEVDRFHAIRQP